MPDNVFKSDQVSDDRTSLTIQNLGPEEKFAGNVLKSLKEKISEARSTIQRLEEEVEEKQEEAADVRERLLEEAREDAEQIREEAREDAEQIRASREEEVEAAREEGRQEGLREGRSKAREEMAEQIELAGRILSEAKRERDARLAEREDELLRLASRLAERVVRETVETDPQLIRRVVDEALDQIRDEQEITLVLNPRDFETIQSVIDDFRAQHPSLESITLSEDPHMDRGGCRIHTRFGDLDATLQGQLEHLTEQVLRG